MSDGGSPARPRVPRVVVGLLLASVTVMPAAARREPRGGLAGLAEPHVGRALRATSNDPSGGNLDFRIIAPGETMTVLDPAGAGTTRRFFVPFLPRRSGPADMRAPLGGTIEDAVAMHRQAIVRMYWDGETSPSVESPLGDFFGVGFG